MLSKSTDRNARWLVVEQCVPGPHPVLQQQTILLGVEKFWHIWHMCHNVHRSCFNAYDKQI